MKNKRMMGKNNGGHEKKRVRRAGFAVAGILWAAMLMGCVKCSKIQVTVPMNWTGIWN